MLGAGSTDTLGLMEVERPFDEQVERVRESLDAAIRLQRWWNSNGTLLHAWSRKARHNHLMVEKRPIALDRTSRSTGDWRVRQIVETALKRNPRYLDVIDDVVAGTLKAAELTASTALPTLSFRRWLMSLATCTV